MVIVLAIFRLFHYTAVAVKDCRWTVVSFCVVLPPCPLKYPSPHLPSTSSTVAQWLGLHTPEKTSGTGYQGKTKLRN